MKLNIPFTISELIEETKKQKKIVMSLEQYKHYDSLLFHEDLALFGLPGKPCGNPCKNLTFQGKKIIIKI